MAKLIEITGKSLSGEWGTDDETGEGIPVLRTTNFTNEGVVDYSNVVTRTIAKKNIEDKYLRPGDIIIEKSGGSDKQPVGRVIYFDGPDKTYLFNNFTGLLRVKNQSKWFPKYVFYSLYGNYRRGGTRPFENKTTGLHNLKTDDYVSRYEVTETEYSKQVEISSHLDKLYSIIKMREEELGKLDELIKARFVELIRNSEYKHIVKMKDVVSEGRIITYGIVKPGTFVEGGQPVIKVKDFPNGEVLTDDILHCSPEIEKKYLRSRVRTGDLLYSIRGSVGRMAFVPKELDGANLTQDTARISVGEGYNPIYIRGVLDLPEIKHQVNMQIKGVAVKGISLAELREIEIPIVDKVLQDQIGEFVKQVDKSKVVKRIKYVYF